MQTTRTPRSEQAANLYMQVAALPTWQQASTYATSRARRNALAQRRTTVLVWCHVAVALAAVLAAVLATALA